MRKRRHAYHSHTSLGSRPKASAVASVSGRKFFHRPSAPRNVGTPLAAETPAPVSTVMRASGSKRSTRSLGTFPLRREEFKRLWQVRHHDVGVAAAGHFDVG